MSESAIRLRDVHKRFGPTPIILGVSLDIARGQRHAIIGPNGAGKTTLFNLMSGRFPVSSGTIELNGRAIDGLAPHQINRLGLSRSFQITSIFSRMSVLENVRCGLLWSRGYHYSFWHLLGRERALNEAALRLLEDVHLATCPRASSPMPSSARSRSASPSPAAPTPSCSTSRRRA
jgi:branched-chain amino acid transport system ATP-binding protein